CAPTTPGQRLLSEFAGSPFSQSSSVTLENCRLLDIGTLTEPLMPSKLKALPVSPVAYVAPPDAVPGLVPTESLASPSARYHATAPDGTAVQLALPAVSV